MTTSETLHSFILAAFIAAMVLTACSASAQDGLALMKNDPGARPSGMGGAFVAMTGDPNATAFNPAAAVGSKQFAVSLRHNTYWNNIRIETGYLASPLFEKTFVHAGIKFASVDNLERRQAPTAQPEALFELRDISAQVGLSRQLSDRLAAGFGIGFFFEKIDIHRGSAFNVDLGLSYRTSPHLQLGAAVNNIGSAFRLGTSGSGFESRDISLPTTYRVGGTYRHREYLGAIDVVVLDDELHLHSGVEWQVDRRLSVRTGYKFNYDSQGFSAGASFTRRNFHFDYAFVPFSNNLGTSHLFNLTIDL